MKRMLITGATGSLGTELVSQYCRSYEVYAHGRDADRLLKLRLQHPGIQLVLGDLRCHGLQDAIARCSVVVHAAAQKYVDLAEKHCFYTIDTNVNCTHELAELATRKGVEHFVFISTDKASAPSNIYGTSKYLAERLIQELTDIHSDTIFSTCRFGNIFGSNGSVIRLWLDAAKRNHEAIQVTDPEMTRFMFSLEDAVATVEFAISQAHSGDIIIPKMGSVSLRDIIDLFDRSKVKIVGKRPGEKTHESLYVEGEISHGYETDLYYVLNRRAPQKLPMVSLDSSQAPRIEPRKLRQWFDKVCRDAA
jgi:UDP-N-acetylglucosamine 4,6-dehydratase/5-epimerase